MSTTNAAKEAGQANRVELRGSRLNYLVTGTDCKGCSLFEVEAAPGFDTGAHYHTKIEEFFYVLEGELDLLSGQQVLHAGPGAFLFVPPGTVHSIANPRSKSARLLLGRLPPGHENYFYELSALVAKSGPPDPDALAALRRRYDTVQLSSLQAK